MVLSPTLKIPTAKDTLPKIRAHIGVSKSSERESTPLSYTPYTPTKGPILFPTLLAPWAKAPAEADIINKGLNKLHALSYYSS